ncbi:NHL repeat-containing protein [Xylariaceae sp. FL0804]|nr:NHL repeat-containing protein [Xylariaceae sp. FL0804]
MWTILAAALPCLAAAVVAAEARCLPRRDVTVDVAITRPQAPLQVQSLYSFATAEAPGAWVENLAVRPNGDLLATRFDAPELWSVDVSGSRTAARVAVFDRCVQSAGIVELRPDVFAVVTGNFTFADGATAGSWGIRKVDFTTAAGGKSTDPAVSTIAMLPDAQFLNGMTKLNDDTLLVGDMTQGLVYKVAVSTGKYSVVARDPSMAPVADAPLPAGIDGLRYHDGFLYFSNIYGRTFNRLAVDPATGAPLTIGGGGGGPDVVQVLFRDMAADDFAFKNGTAYVATNDDDTVVRVDPGQGHHVTKVADVNGSTSVVFGRTPGHENTMYVGSSDGSISLVQLSA